MTIHLISLAHTETTSEFEFCAYTAKTRKMATMLTKAGQDVILYAGEHNEATVSEHVALMTRQEQQQWWPDWHKENEAFNDFDAQSPGWLEFNSRAVAAIQPRLNSGDIVAFTMGWTQRNIWTQLYRPDVFPVEVGIGYPGVWAPYRVYESWAWRHFLAAREASDDVRFFDTVIPNFFEADAFPAGTGKGGYYLFMGRLTNRKGPHIAAEAAKQIGAKLLVAGQGVSSVEPGRIICADGTQIEGDVEYVGVVQPKERAQLMGGATALFVPTTYLEPFGGVSVEAQMTGTPAIVSDWGGLTENVEQGATGFRCSMLADFTAAALAAPSLDRRFIRAHAQSTWSTDVIAPRYLSYFSKLETLFRDGWYAKEA